jgi:sugar diacid utilization regulator
VLADAVAELGAPVVGTDGTGLAVAFVPAADDEVVATGVRRSLTRLAPGLPGVRLTAGVSRVTTPGAVGGALRSARHARLMGGRDAGPVQVTTSAEVASAVLLASMAPDDVRATYTEQVLGPVLEYDTRNDAGLLTTLRAYFDCSTSWSRTAAHLHLHLNTVRYRILRVEELTGRDLSTMSDRADVYLALQLL